MSDEHDDREQEREDEYLHMVTQINTYASAIGRVDGTALRKLGHRQSRRGKQRALALFLGHLNAGAIYVSTLRRLCISHEIYNRANFAQDMKKDSTNNPDRGLWIVNTKREGRELVGAWVLTEKGEALAAAYIETANLCANTTGKRERALEMLQNIKDSIKIKSKAASCPFCRDEVGDDKAECGVCHHQMHATCMAEFHNSRCRSAENPCESCDYCKFGQDACINARTTAYCSGTYQVIKPAKKKLLKKVRNGR